MMGAGPPGPGADFAGADFGKRSGPLSRNNRAEWVTRPRLARLFLGSTDITDDAPGTEQARSVLDGQIVNLKVVSAGAKIVSCDWDVSREKRAPPSRCPAANCGQKRFRSNPATAQTSYLRGTTITSNSCMLQSTLVLGNTQEIYADFGVRRPSVLPTATANVVTSTTTPSVGSNGINIFSGPQALFKGVDAQGKTHAGMTLDAAPSQADLNDFNFVWCQILTVVPDVLQKTGKTPWLDNAFPYWKLTSTPWQTSDSPGLMVPGVIPKVRTYDYSISAEMFYMCISKRNIRASVYVPLAEFNWSCNFQVVVG